MKIIGFTSGFNYKSIPPVSKQVVKIIRKLGCKAIEINCIGGHEDNSLSDLSQLKKADLADFQYISLHAPSRNVKYRQDKPTRKMLNDIQSAVNKFDVQYVIMHPDTVEDWSVFEKYTLPIAIENMDNRKKSHKDAKDLFHLFLNDRNLKFVLDLNHCFTNDSTMWLAEDLMNNFGNRLVEIHISGYNKYHAPIYQTKQIEILEAIPNIEVPIIIESTCANVAEARKEFEFVKRFVGKGGMKCRNFKA